MSDVPQPTSGSLYARVIRACSKHNNKCALNCPRRKVEELGQIASFDTGKGVPRWQAWFRQLVRR